MTKTNKKIIEEFRKKWGRFYISDVVGVDWIKPKKCFRKSGVFCVASDDIENDFLKALAQQKEEIKRVVEEIKLDHDIFYAKITPIQTLEKLLKAIENL